MLNLNRRQWCSPPRRSTMHMPGRSTNPGLRHISVSKAVWMKKPSSYAPKSARLSKGTRLDRVRRDPLVTVPAQLPYHNIQPLQWHVGMNSKAQSMTLTKTKFPVLKPAIGTQIQTEPVQTIWRIIRRSEATIGIGMVQIQKPGAPEIDVITISYY